MDISISSLSLEIPAAPGKVSTNDGSTTASELSLAGEDTGPPASQSWQEPVDFIAMVALVLEHDVHQLELEESTGLQPEPWQQRNMYNSFSLGEGASSFLQVHSMRQSVELSDRTFQIGDRVALKRSFVDRFDDDVGVTPAQYDFIKRELRVFCHEKLSRHENICKLLFVGWEQHTPAPVLGLELAEYGTLKDLLFDVNMRDYSNVATHLVLDIAQGLNALHGAKIVHGDVKTGNVLVFAHPQRQVVAKLSDFSDSFLMEDEKTWSPVGGTHSWRAPECYGTTKYDLKKTDVYSFGLCALAVLAQGIFYRSANNTGLGDCFLVRLKELDGMTKSQIQTQVTSWKQDESNLVLQWGLGWAEAITEGDENAKKSAQFAVAACLWREQDKRKDMQIIINGLFELLGPEGDQRRFVSQGLAELTDRLNDTLQIYRNFESSTLQTNRRDRSDSLSRRSRMLSELRVASVSTFL
jgi:serine/threonine protein kinase